LCYGTATFKPVSGIS